MSKSDKPDEDVVVLDSVWGVEEKDGTKDAKVANMKPEVVPYIPGDPSED